MSLINCKVELSLKWIENCVLTTAANANKVTFEITDAKLYDPIVTLSIEDYAKLSKLLDEIRKITAEQDDNYRTGCLLDFAYFEKSERLIAADLSFRY